MPHKCTKSLFFSLFIFPLETGALIWNQGNWFWHASHIITILLLKWHTRSRWLKCSIIWKKCGTTIRLPDMNRSWKLSGFQSQRENRKFAKFLLFIHRWWWYSITGKISILHPTATWSFVSPFSHSFYIFVRIAKEKRIECSWASRELDTCSGWKLIWYKYSECDTWWVLQKKEWNLSIYLCQIIC